MTGSRDLQEPVTATVTNVCGGQNGKSRYVVTVTSDGDGNETTITFSLHPKVWEADDEPFPSQTVLLSGLIRTRNGIRATSACCAKV